MKALRYFSGSLFFCFLFLFSINTLAQNPPMSFGKIDKEWLEMQSYDKDPEAEAVIIGDFGEINIDYSDTKGLSVNFTRLLRIKIFSNKGFEQGDFSIPLYFHNNNRKESIPKIKGSTYHLENGKIVKTNLDRKNIFMEDINEKWKKQSFTMPNLTEGCVFEVEYTLNSPFLFSFPTWRFQHGIPAELSELWVGIPEYFKYKQLMKGFLRLSDHEFKYRTGRFGQFAFEEHFTRYVMRNVPAFRSEPYMNSVKNYYSQIDFELTAVQFPGRITDDYSSNWNKINEELTKENNFGNAYRRTSLFKEEAEAIKSIMEDPKDQAIAAFDMVKKRMNWNGMHSIYKKPNSIRVIWNERAGNVADINLLLVAFLRELGLDANPVIISTRDNGMIHPAQIMLQAFNYVIAHVQIGNESLLLDATEEGLPYNLLPIRCLNGQGRLIADQALDSRWVEIKPQGKNDYTSLSELKVLPNGNLTGSIQHAYTNYWAYEAAQEIKKQTNTDKYTEYLEGQITGLNIKSIEFENEKDLSKPMNRKMEVEIVQNDDSPKNTIFINPLLFEKMASNPFKLEKREFPVDFTYPRKQRIINNFEIPEGYKVSELPKAVAWALPRNAGSFRYNASVMNNRIQVMVNFDINTEIISPTDYEALKEFFSNLVAKHNEMIVLEKI